MSKKAKNSKSLKIKAIIKYSPFYLPALIIYSILFIYPIISAFYYSMTDWTGLGVKFNFIGLQNFKELFHNKTAMDALKQTLKYAILFTVGGNLAGLIMAHVFNVASKLTNITKTVFFIPYVFNYLVIGYMWVYIYNPVDGILNNSLKALGLDFLVKTWLGDKSIVIPAIVFTMIWQFTGANALIYLSGLRSIPEFYYEAAHIDGASRFKIFKHITFPFLAPATTVNVMMALIGGLKIFDIIFVMTDGGPGNSSSSITSLVYQFAFSRNLFGYGTALGGILFIMIAIISVILTKYLRSREVEV